MNPFRALIANDGYAATFQTMGQYRTSLLAAWPTYLDLENLADELLAPREIRRDADGHLDHPAMPTLDENLCYGEFLAAFGLECHVVFMEYDDVAAWERYGEAEIPDCSYWTPSTPSGDGWSLLSIADTEDGPQAVFARRKPDAPHYSYRTHTSPYQAKVTRVKRATGELLLQLDHQVPDRMHAGATVDLHWRTERTLTVAAPAAPAPTHKCITCGSEGGPDPVIECTRCGFDDMQPIAAPAPAAQQTLEEITELIELLADDGAFDTDPKTSLARSLEVQLRRLREKVRAVEEVEYVVNCMAEDDRTGCGSKTDLGRDLECEVQRLYEEIESLKTLAAPAPAAQAAHKRDEYTGDPEREWQDFWRDIVAPGGVLDVEQVKRELSDYSMLLNYVPCVYMHVTGGRVSYPNTLPSAVCSVHDDHVNDLCEEASKEALDSAGHKCGEAGATQAARDVLAERQRQISAEGWTPEHDDRATDGALSLAAATYALHGPLPTHGKTPLTWPWAPEGWKPSMPRRNLVKAGALILAEIERFDRAENAAAISADSAANSHTNREPNNG